MGLLLMFVRKIFSKKMVYRFRYIYFSLLYGFKRPENMLKNTVGKRFIIVNTPEHDNLGDHAIALAEEKFLSDYFGGYGVVEITHHMYLARKAQILRLVKAEDVIIIQGGGYLGSLWFNNEIFVRDVVLSFPNNKIIFFPQTIFYENFSDDNAEFVKTKECYSRHKGLFFVARERKTHDFVKEFFADCFVDVILTPDIVLYLNGEENNGIRPRDGMILYMRSEHEKSTEQDACERLAKCAALHSLPLSYTDTYAGRIVTSKTRRLEISKKLNELRASKIVVTDRLHGMIFSVLTGTPCIALDNVSGKVRGIYEFIKYLDYVRFAENVDEAEKYIAEFSAMGSCRYSNEPIMHYYDSLAKFVEAVIAYRLD